MQKTSRILMLSFGALLLVSLVVPVSMGRPVTRLSVLAPQYKAAKPITINGPSSTGQSSAITSLTFTPRRFSEIFNLSVTGARRIQQEPSD
jgi:hypothetical protein